MAVCHNNQKTGDTIVKSSLTRVALGAALMLTLFIPPVLAQPKTLIVYALDAPIRELAQAYTQATGVPVEYRMGIYTPEIESPKTQPADLILGHDLARLREIADADLLRPVASRSMARKIPAAHRDPENRWYGLAMKRSMDGNYQSVLGAAVLNSSTNPVEAGQFLKWLAGRTAQRILSQPPAMEYILATQ